MGYHHQEEGLTKQESHYQEFYNRFVFWKQRTCHIWQAGFDGCIQELAMLYLASLTLQLRNLSPFAWAKGDKSSRSSFLEITV
jgi:hypothetical protein